MFHLWTGISTIAGALRRRVWIDEYHFQWTPNFYIILVGPPGVAAKSTSINAGTKLLYKLRDRGGEFADISFGPESVTWQALTGSLEKAYRVYELPNPGAPDDPFKYAMSCITIVASELGTFLRPDDDQFLSVLTDLWDGKVGDWSRGTKTQGDTVIKNPWINVIGATTPAWLERNFPPELIGEGLTSRIVFVFGDKKRRFVAYPSQEQRSAEYLAHEEKLVDDLGQIAQMLGEYKLTPEAIEWGTTWYEHHNTSRPITMASERFGGYIARKQTHLHKIAMVFAAAKRDKLWIELEDLERANTLLTTVETDMHRVFESIGVVDEHKHVNTIAGYVAAYNWIEGDELWSRCRASMSQRDFAAATMAGVRAGILSRESVEGKTGLALGPRARPTTPTEGTLQ